METVSVKAGRHTFECSSKDKIMFNGVCYILITKKIWVDWLEVSPTVSKTEFNRLKKLRILSEPHIKKGFSGMNVQIYNFKLGE